MASSASSCSFLATDEIYPPRAAFDRDLNTNLKPDIPPRKSSRRYAIRTTRSGNSLRGEIRTVPSLILSKRSNVSESKTFLKSRNSPPGVKAKPSSSSRRSEWNPQKRPAELDLSKSGDAPFPSPPPRFVCGAQTPDVQASEAVEAFPFPLSPKPLVSSGLLTPTKRRALSAGASPEYQPSTSDRFIPSRSRGDDLTRTYKISKSPQDLSPEERLVRTDGANPDPFTARRITPTGQPARNGGPRPLRSTTSLPPRNPSGVQNRVISAGGVWNVGGSGPVQQRPVAGVPNGRGGLLGSGTNAPMFSSTFFKSETPHESQERFEGRLAIALDLDRTSRVFNFSHSKKGPSPTPKASPQCPGTIWKDGKWLITKSDKVLDAPTLRDDFYCTVLAYCPVLRVLAVGLSNRVYLWSESHGVRYPPRADDDIRDIHVTTMDFSSALGACSILAIGRSNGKLNLWSPHEPMDRLQHPFPKAIACVRFKPVPTRRYSERQCATISTEELLVGNEAGDVYYYSIEWPNPDANGQNSAIIFLLAKIDIHKQQICGIAWSPDGEYFATGGNDNACLLFSVRDILQDLPHQSRNALLILPMTPPTTPPMNALAPRFVPNETLHYTLNSRAEGSGSFDHNTPPRQYFRSIRSSQARNRRSLIITGGRERHRWPHSAAVKAIAFCPWQRGLIATGGGSNDRAIHFFHTWSGACLATINVQAQVTSLIWSKTRREIAATFGYAQPEHPYRIAVFSWPDCKQVVSIPWAGEMRALYAIAYPGGPNETGKCKKESEGGRWWSRTADEGCIVVAGSDESVKFHEIWSGSGTGMGNKSGGLGWSEILEGLEGVDGDWGEVIR